MNTRSALTAQAIRKDLKRAYPTTKFTVHSKNYSGGDSISIHYVQTVTGAKEKDIEALLSKYVAGHFDGMTDCYNYNSDNQELTTKYLFIEADLENLKQEDKGECMNYYGLETDSDEECYKRLHDRFTFVLYKFIREIVLARV